MSKVLLWVAVVFLTGCRSVVEFAAVDVSQPGWGVEQGQAVWKPKPAGPELSGELLWASHADGRFLLQFLKTPITLVEAQGDASDWQIAFPPQGRSFSGSRGGPPSPRLGWLYLAAALQGRSLANGWTFAQRNNQSWELKNPRTGEQIEGYLSQ